NRSHAGYRDGLCNLYESLVRLQMDREDHAAAMRAAEQLVLEMPKYWLAALRAARAAHQSLEMVRHDRTLPSDSRAARAREYEDLADRWWARAMERAGKNAEAQDE